MSFTIDVKEELSRVEPVCSHCNYAVLSALVRGEGSLRLSGSNRFSLEISIDVVRVARLCVQLLHELCGLQTNVVVRRSVLHKTPNYLIEVPYQEKLREAMRKLGIWESSGSFTEGIKPSLVSKQCCAAAYLRGAFMGRGFVSDPRGDFHFEITVDNKALANDLVELMARKHIAAKVTARRNSYMVYLKSGTAIMDFLAFAGAHNNALSLENARIIKSLRNEVNRSTNAELANQAKTTHSIVDQLFAIREVVQHHGMDNLPQALQEYIRLRVAHPDATLKELGEHANPPLSKSAIYHRVRRIEQLARNLRSEV